jgi:uncharacterized protein YerC
MLIDETQRPKHVGAWLTETVPVELAPLYDASWTIVAKLVEEMWMASAPRFAAGVVQLSNIKPSTVKRLFAHSGNNCAFPKCVAPIVDDTTVIGEICHIEADQPGGPRYNPMQSEEARRDYDNLILLCANHHTVIDDDDESYPVGRLKKMKLEHEARVKPITETEAASGAILLLDQSVTTHNQSGGIAAHIVNANEINFISSALKPSGRKEQAVEAIWQNIVALRNEYSDVAFIDIILTPDEINSFLSGRASHPMFDTVRHYASMEVMANKVKRTINNDTQKERPFLSTRAWALYGCLQAVNSRAGFLLHLSFKQRKYENWRDDHSIEAHLRAVLAPDEIDRLKSNHNYLLKNILDRLEQLFVEETRKV